MIRPISLLVCLIVLPLALVGCRSDDPVWPKDAKPRVLAVFPPLYCFAQNVAGDDAHVLCLLTDKGPHGFKGEHQEIVKAQRANVILAFGLGLDDFIFGIANGGNNAQAIFKVGDKLPEEKLILTQGEKHGDHYHGAYDPHLWLSPPHAILLVEIITDKLCEIDKANEAGYRERAGKYIAKLRKLHEDGKAELAKKSNRRIISMHDALRYFGDAFGVEVAGVIRPDPDSEAAAGQVASLVKTCQEKNVRVIAVEPQYPKRAAEALQKELAAKGFKIDIVEIDPIETAPMAAGSSNPDPAYYLERMHANIDNLAKALP